MSDTEMCERSAAECSVRAAENVRVQLRRRGVVICISGIDGSGKTTLAHGLARTLRKSGIPVRHVHCYSWYANLFVTPWVLLHNRYIRRKALILDRSIYDNIAVVAARRCCPRWLFRSMVRLISGCYPKYDYRFYLAATFEETLRRRPDTSRSGFVTLKRIYKDIVLRIGYVQLNSDSRLFAATLQHLSVRGV